MVTLYTSSSCSSCRKAKRWFESNNIKYREKNIIGIRLTRNDIINMLKYSENGFEDIISTRSKVFKESNIVPDEMKFSELAEFIIDNPTVLKRPIIINDQIMQTGYNQDEIRAFIPRELRKLLSCDDCEYNIPGEDCEYEKCLKKAFAKNME
ncbi:MAG: transcriptional regulator Spx [Tenericutes bacterium]|nr:transcriptional regulator Spx [Mycoplasmatota bacterium]